MMSIEHGYTNPGRLIFFTVAPDTCRASVWLSHLVPLIAPRILWWLLDFGKICGPPGVLHCCNNTDKGEAKYSDQTCPSVTSSQSSHELAQYSIRTSALKIKYVHCVYIKIQPLPHRKHSLFELEMPFGACGCYLWEENGTRVLFGQKVIRGGTYSNHGSLKRTNMRAVWHAGVCLSQDPSLVGKEAVSVCIRRLRGAGFML